ncbi:hypothetical protein V6N13_060352 [Hibiscus sabdariffa]
MESKVQASIGWQLLMYVLSQVISGLWAIHSLHFNIVLLLNVKLNACLHKARGRLAACEADLRMLKGSTETGKNALAEPNSWLEHANRELKEKLATCEAELSNLRDTMEAGKNAWMNQFHWRMEIPGPAFQMSKTSLFLPMTSIQGRIMKPTNEDAMLAEVGKENELLKEKVSSLEAKLSEEGKETLKLLKTIAELETQVKAFEKITKEKDEALSGRKEEVAIRELCQLIDHHRSHYDQLREMISNNTGRTKKKT